MFKSFITKDLTINSTEGNKLLPVAILSVLSNPPDHARHLRGLVFHLNGIVPANGESIDDLSEMDGNETIPSMVDYTTFGLTGNESSEIRAFAQQFDCDLLSLETSPVVPPFILEELVKQLVQVMEGETPVTAHLEGRGFQEVKIMKVPVSDETPST